jgi:hypothetical protein
MVAWQVKDKVESKGKKKYQAPSIVVVDISGRRPRTVARGQLSAAPVPGRWC